MTIPPPESTITRGTYRHGDLRRALLDAGVALARAGGPAAVVLREATRRAGVVPNAAYRHFPSHQALLQAVRAVALGRLAAAAEAELAAVPPDSDRLAHARAGLRAIGTAYMRFALAEPGLFRTGFAPGSTTLGPELRGAGPGGLDPFEILAATLDALVAAGGLPPERRPGAEYLAWSAVHGLAMLIIDGPLHAWPKAQAEAIGQKVLDMVEKGL
jgi:AcrR family transcriptional regulator